MIYYYLKQFCCYEQDGLPRFYGGAAGYFSFESVRFFERCGEVKENDGRFPDASFFISDHLAIFDNFIPSLYIPSNFVAVTSALTGPDTV